MSVNEGVNVAQMCEYAQRTPHIIRSYLKIDSGGERVSISIQCTVGK